MSVRALALRGAHDEAHLSMGRRPDYGTRLRDTKTAPPLVAGCSGNAGRQATEGGPAGRLAARRRRRGAGVASGVDWASAWTAGSLDFAGSADATGSADAPS